MAVDYGESAAIAITVFILTINISLFIIPFKLNLNKNVLIDLILKRCVLIMAFFFMTLNTGIMFSMATQASLDVAQQLIFYTWFFGYGGYLMMAFTIIKTVIDFAEVKKFERKKQRGGSY